MADYTHVSQVYDLVYAERTADTDFYLAAVAAAVRDGARCVLEIGAGTGRVLVPSAQAHPEIEFTALDLDADELDVVKAKVHDLALDNVEIVCTDIADLEREDCYDLVTAPFRVLQHCLSTEALSAAFGVVRAALKPGGRFVFDLFNPSIPMLAQTGLVVAQEFTDADGRSVAREVFVNDRSYFEQVQHVEEYYRIGGPDGPQLSWIYDTRYFFLGEVEPLLRLNGFAIESVHSDYAGTPFGSGAYPGDLVFTAVKV